MDAKQFWNTMFVREELWSGDSIRARLSVATRLVRELARLKGVVQDHQPLRQSALLEKYWTTPTTFLEPYPKGPANIRKALIPIGPPQTKNPNDTILLRWLDTLDQIAHSLGMYTHSKGLRGMYQLLTSKTVHEIFPGQEEIFAHERYQLEEILQVQINTSTMQALTYLKEVENFTPPEARRSLKMARNQASDLASSDLEQEKSLMILRVEETLQKAKDQQDIRAELQALKLLTVVQGLHHVKTDDTMKQLIKVIGETGEKFERKISPAEQAKLIEAEKVENKDGK